MKPTHLRRAGVSLVLAPSRAAEPAVLHWGGDLGPLDEAALADLVAATRPGVSHSAVDAPRRAGLLADPTSGYTGLPALEGVRPDDASVPWAPRLSEWTWRVDDAGPVSGRDARVELTGVDEESGWRVDVEVELTREGLVRQRARVTDTGPGPLEVRAVRVALPVPAYAAELLDLTGRWSRERHPQRRPWLLGTHLREGRHGRTGHDATLLMAVGRPGFGFGHGEVWATHLAWSGDHQTYAERTPEGECVLGGGELLGPGEIVLAPGESYQGPWLVGAYAAAGLDAASARLHDWLRRHAPRSRSTRKVLINTWEGVYFDHDLTRLTALADAAASVGVERFVLDDGWFAGRHDDHTSLGDWRVDTEVWPDGLHPLIEAVHARDMDFGLWVEPEMVNERSEVARAHPDWILRGRRDLPPDWRHQQVLDLQHPGAYAHVRDALLALLAEYDIAFLKWDHNRDLIDVAHAGRPAVHGQTLAFYRLLEEVRAAHPGLEIETCASGGGRIDLEVLTRTDRVWPSDTIDPLERHGIQRWTSLLVPPEMLGVHIGSEVAHTTGRAAPLRFRAATALFGHLGLESDLTQWPEADLADLRAWIDLHQRLRPVLADGALVRGDVPDPAASVTGVVSRDRRRAWFTVTTEASTITQGPGQVRLPGLDPGFVYTLTERTPAGARHPADMGDTVVDGPPIRLSGAALGAVGLRLPALAPMSAFVFEVVAD